MSFTPLAPIETVSGRNLAMGSRSAGGSTVRLLKALNSLVLLALSLEIYEGLQLKGSHSDPAKNNSRV